MKKIELNREKLQLKKQKIASLSKMSGEASHIEPTTTVLLTIQHRCILPAKANA